MLLKEKSMTMTEFLAKTVNNCKLEKKRRGYFLNLCLFVYFETEIFILLSDEGLKISKEKKWIQI